MRQAFRFLNSCAHTHLLYSDLSGFYEIPEIYTMTFTNRANIIFWRQSFHTASQLPSEIVAIQTVEYLPRKSSDFNSGRAPNPLFFACTHETEHLFWLERGSSLLSHENSSDTVLNVPWGRNRFHKSGQTPGGQDEQPIRCFERKNKVGKHGCRIEESHGVRGNSRNNNTEAPTITCDKNCYQQ